MQCCNCDEVLYILELRLMSRQPGPWREEATSCLTAAVNPVSQRRDGVQEALTVMSPEAGGGSERRTSTDDTNHPADGSSRRCSSSLLGDDLSHRKDPNHVTISQQPDGQRPQASRDSLSHTHTGDDIIMGRHKSGRPP